MKLGFLITKTKNGYAKGQPINGGPWGQFAYDIRSFTRYFLDDFDEVGKEVILLRFLGMEGFLVGVFRTESGRLGDNTTAWIYVPSDMRISGKELEEVVNAVKVEIRKHLVSMDDIRESCRRLFEKDYSHKNVSVTAVGRVRSKGIGTVSDAQGKSGDGNPSAKEKEEVAGLYYGDGGYQLQELLGDYLAQPEYGNWAGVFLIDGKSGIRARNELPSSSLRKTVVFSLPEPDYGFKASYKNPELQGSVEVLEGEQIDIIWSRKGYMNVQKSIRINKLDVENQRQTKISPNEKMYGVNRSWFKIVDEDGTDIGSGCSIKVNTIELLPCDETTYICEDKGYEVVICCYGYKTMRGEETYREEFSSFNGQIPPVRLKANRIEKEYILSPDEADGLKYEAKVRIETKYPDDPEKKLPIIGYDSERGKLLYNDFSSAWARIKWFLIGFLVMAAIWGISSGTEYMRENYSFKKQWPFIERIEKTDSNRGKGKDTGGKSSSDDVKTEEPQPEAGSPAVEEPQDTDAETPQKTEQNTDGGDNHPTA